MRIAGAEGNHPCERHQVQPSLTEHRTLSSGNAAVWGSGALTMPPEMRRWIDDERGAVTDCTLVTSVATDWKQSSCGKVAGASGESPTAAKDLTRRSSPRHSAQSTYKSRIFGDCIGKGSAGETRTGYSARDPTFNRLGKRLEDDG